MSSDAQHGAPGSLISARDQGECSFCGSQCGQTSADLTADIHAAFERLVRAAPPPDPSDENDGGYADAWAECRRMLGVN